MKNTIHIKDVRRQLIALIEAEGLLGSAVRGIVYIDSNTGDRNELRRVADLVYKAARGFEGRLARAVRHRGQYVWRLEDNPTYLRRGVSMAMTPDEELEYLSGRAAREW